MTASYQPQRRSRPVETPTSPPIFQSFSPSSSKSSVGNGPGADAGRVGLDHADDPVDPGRADAGAGADAAGDRVGRRHERVGAVVDVEHRRLGALEQHRLAVVERLVEQQRGVGDQRPQPVGVRQQLLDDRVDVDRAPVVDLGEQLVLHLERRLDLLAQDLLVEEVGDPDADAVDLVGVRRADAAAGRADLVLAEEALGDLVDGRVVRRDHVRVGAHHEAAHVDAAGDQRVELAEQRLRRDHHAVADHRGAAGGQDAARQQVGGELLAVRPRSCGRRCGRRWCGRRSRCVSVVASRSVALPLPSSPHWAPRTTIAGIGTSCSADGSGTARRPRRGPLGRSRPYPTAGAGAAAVSARVRAVDPLLVITNADAGTADEEALDGALDDPARGAPRSRSQATSNPGELDGVLQRAGVASDRGGRRRRQPARRGRGAAPAPRARPTPCSACCRWAPATTSPAALEHPARHRGGGAGGRSTARSARWT